MYVTSDFENWVSASDTPFPPAAAEALAPKRPESGARVRGQAADRTRLYAIGRFAHRSEDAGATWSNVTAYRNASIIGDGLTDLAISPRDSEELVIAASTGVWRSLDGGLSWSGLNQGLPNLRVEKLLGLPADTRGVRIAVSESGQQRAYEWMPGEKQAWRPVEDVEFNRDRDLRRAVPFLPGPASRRSRKPRTINMPVPRTVACGRRRIVA